MKRNVGIADRIVRMFVAFVILFLVAMGFVRSWSSIALGGLGAYLGLTALVGYCPIFGLFAISTNGRA
jgi:hypothetical protein